MNHLFAAVLLYYLFSKLSTNSCWVNKLSNWLNASFYKLPDTSSIYGFLTDLIKTIICHLFKAFWTFRDKLKLIYLPLPSTLFSFLKIKSRLSEALIIFPLPLSKIFFNTTVHNRTQTSFWKSISDISTSSNVIFPFPSILL